MARVPLNIAAADPATGNALSGVTATIRNRSTGATVTLYAAETGATTVGNPLTTDANGRAVAWVDRAPIRIDYAGSGITAYTEYRDVGPSSDRGIDSVLLPYGALPDFVTSLPASPQDGQEVYFVADATAGVVWHLRYRAASGSAYKWEVVGGPPLLAEVTTAETPGSNAAYVDLTTVGPQVTVPLAGEYDTAYGAQFVQGVANNGQSGYMGLRIGVTEASDNDALSLYIYDADGSGLSDRTVSLARHKTFTVPAAATVVKARYKQGSSPTTFTQRWVRVWPVRVG